MPLFNRSNRSNVEFSLMRRPKLVMPLKFNKMKNSSEKYFFKKKEILWSGRWDFR